MLTPQKGIRFIETRQNCPRCGDTRGRLYIKELPTGYLYHCHNENCFAKDSFKRKDKLTPTEILAKRTVKQDVNDFVIDSTIRLPYDYSQSIIPLEGKRWLDKYQITESEVQLEGIGYSQYLDRLILPVYNKERVLVFWQGRNLGVINKLHPKYMNIRNSSAKNVFYRRYQEKSKTVCIVEDILSGIKVGRVVNSLALLGSYFPKEIYQELLQYDKISIWLDEDKYFSALKFAKKLTPLVKGKVQIIRTPKDPKEYTTEELKHYLEVN